MGPSGEEPGRATTTRSSIYHFANHFQRGGNRQPHPPRPQDRTISTSPEGGQQEEVTSPQDPRGPAGNFATSPRGTSSFPPAMPRECGSPSSITSFPANCPSLGSPRNTSPSATFTKCWAAAPGATVIAAHRRQGRRDAVSLIRSCCPRLMPHGIRNWSGMCAFPNPIISIRAFWKNSSITTICIDSTVSSTRSRHP